MGVSPAATPFSRWTYHRAWWDAYASTAHPQYLVCVDAATPRSADAPLHADAIRAIAPLMHRHAVEPGDAATATHLRGEHAPGATVEPTAKVVFFGASYHTDYATILASDADLPAAARAVVASLAGPPDTSHGRADWDAVDLRRLRAVDPALDALEAAFAAEADTNDWSVAREQEDVCPVVTFAGSGWEEFLGTLDKKDRHEIRRKVRRLEGAGDARFSIVDPTPDQVDAFIDLHQARWGDQGLFPDSEGGARSRRFMHRLAALELTDTDRQLQLGRLDVDGRLIFFAAGFDDGETCYFYNAGASPDARELSPGVTGAAAYVRDRLEAGRHRFDFLRGNETYKYEWGAVDEPIHRLLITRRRR